MQHNGVQQEQQTCVLQDNAQFIQEIATLRSRREAELPGISEELDIFKHEVEHLDAECMGEKRGESSEPR